MWGIDPAPRNLLRSESSPMKLAQTLVASLALAASLALVTTASHAGLVAIGPQPDEFAGNPTSELNRLLSYLDSGDLQPNGSFIKYNPGVNVVDSSGDLLAAFDDSITVPGITISGANLAFTDTTPLYFLVKAGTQQSIFFYDGLGDVSLLNPIVNGSGIPKDYSHVTFFGIDVPTPTPTPPTFHDQPPTDRVPDGGATVMLMGFGLLGVAGIRRTTRKG